MAERPKSKSTLRTIKSEIAAKLVAQAAEVKKQRSTIDWVLGRPARVEQTKKRMEQTLARIETGLSSSPEKDRMEQALARIEVGLLAKKEKKQRLSPTQVVAIGLFPNGLPATMQRSEAIVTLANEMKRRKIKLPSNRTLRRVIDQIIEGTWSGQN
jgi:hypothetical protein